MGIYSKCCNIGKKVRQQGIASTVFYYKNRKRRIEEEQKRIRQYHVPGGEDLEQQRQTVWQESPLMSIIVPLYNTPKDFLKQMIESVQSQTYSNWELCLADGSDDAHDYVEEVCNTYAKNDSRIVYHRLVKNEGIVGNTNCCIDLASGEYLGLLDHDDILHPSALYEVAKAIEKSADFIYTDEMKFRDMPESSTDIVCKNGFGKDELRSHNYICHFVVFKKSLLEGMAELYRSECEGSQDYDMVLRLTEKAEHIVHIPKILYYWRVHEGSVSMNLAGKQYAVDSAKQALGDQLKRTGELGKVACNLPYETIYRISYNIRKNPLVSVILKGNNRKTDLSSYVKNLLERTTYRPLEIVCAGLDEAIFCGNGVIFSEKASGEYFIFLTDDCLPLTDMWIEEMLMYAQREDVGCVGPWILYRNHTTCFAGAVLDSQEPSGIHLINRGMPEDEQGYEANMRHVRNTTILTGRCLMIARKRFSELGGFDSEMKGFRDADLCLKSRDAGYWNVWTCFAKIESGRSPGKDVLWKESDVFRKKWSERLRQEDEFYHPLLKALQWM